MKLIFTHIHTATRQKPHEVHGTEATCCRQ